MSKPPAGSEHPVHLIRCDRPEVADQAFVEVWPEVPTSGRVALVTSLVDTQGEVGEGSVPLHVVLAAVRRLSSEGASVQVVTCPGRLESMEAHDASVTALMADGVEVTTSGEGRSFDVGGRVLASAGVLEAVVEAEHLALLAWSGPHHLLQVCGPLLILGHALTPGAREALWTGAARPEVVQSALTELADALGPSWVASWAGAPLNVLAGGRDTVSVDGALRQCLGLEGPEGPIDGLDPQWVRREAKSARSSLPEGPDRYPGVDGSLCTRCDSCVQVCPTGAVTLPEDEEQPVVFDYNACLRCGICVTACPDFAISPSVRPMGARLQEVTGLRLSPEGLQSDEREAAVPIAAAMALGPAAIDAPPRRPAWLDGYRSPERHQRDRSRERHPEDLTTQQVLDRDGAVRLVIPPSWGIRGNRTSLGIAYLAGSLEASEQPFHVVDLAHEMRSCDPVLHEALSVLGDPRPNGGIYGPEVPLILQVVEPEAWGEDCPVLARQIHESAERDAQRIADPAAVHGLIVADSNVTYAFALGAAIRRLGGRVVFGGPTMSHPPTAELALRADVVDAVVVGEGEAALLALARAHREDAWESLGDEPVPGLVWLRGDRVLRQPNFRNRALDALPFPDWRGQTQPPEFTPLLAARGCVTKCSFCSEQTISPKFSQRSVEDVLTEMDLLHEATGQTRFEFNDDLLNGNMKWLEAFCHALLARDSPYQWQGLCRPHRMDYETLTLMRDAGCVQVTYGVQHFSWNMLKIMGRKEEPDPLRQVLDDTLSLGMLMYIDVIIGHPGETEEDFEITVSVVRELMLLYPNIAINLNPFNYIYGAAVDLFPDQYGVSLERFSDELPERFSHLAPVAGQYVVSYEQSPDQETVIDRVNRLSWTVFQTRMPPKIPILDEELPFCNDNCLHCGVADIMQTANVVPLPQIVQSLQHLAPRSGGRVMFAVSELTIRPDFVQIIEACGRAGMKTIALVTNARMFAYPQFTQRTVDAGLTHALVSVYGPTARVHEALTRTPGSFEQTIAGLRALLGYPQVTVMTNTVITKKNYRYLPQMVELLAGLGVRNVNLSFVQIIGAAARYAEPLIPRIRDVLPHLREAVDLGVELGLNMGIGGLPYCVLKGYEQHFGVDDLTTIANSDEADNITARSPYTQAESCRRCAYNAVCLGMQEEYLARYGEEELDPYHGRRLERRPDSEIVRAMFPDMQYTDRGLPSSLFATSQPAGLATMTVSGAVHSGQG